MRIYSMQGLFINDENPYAMLTALEPTIWSKQETYDSIKKGTTLDMKVLPGDENKPIGDFIMMGMSALVSRMEVIQLLNKFAPKNTINAIAINGVDGNFQFIAPENHKPSDSGIAHIFMMFSHYKSLLVTQLVKDEWERLGLTGAVFNEVAEMDDERFIAVE